MAEHSVTTDVVYAKSRVLLVDQYDHILLLLTRHDVDTYPARWLTTGGHLEAGEDHPTAAIRELFEETGLVIDDPGQAFWSRDFVAERAPGVWASHHEVWYSVRTDRFEIDTSNWTPEELVDIVDQRWWSLRELEATTEPIEPENLARLLRNQLSTC
ncbi:NUDIX hydrolase [Agreia pratensis]|uniref:ADP-ribose pyrophosphatase YjhB, NUDIX family n=1 Tax=Agreia pratensis TaxID=150121 RepID=A0A1X7KDL2_9MICO|nr:NUDIX domain-containing protein [Agreia pratensis]SMG38970.1 ADP-ribose pyrophosphatase YjhB, NUDIX family [Agreia pratensis]